jgi:SAM-dependent methyltransferase
MSTQTWHYGVVARYWAEFNVGGPEIDYFRQFVAAGQPALDVGCGTGRLLLPYLLDGLDVDGCDVSADMLARCREQAEREGLSPRLYEAAMHELDLPRRYRTVFACGAFGIGSTREHDLEALRRFREHLEPGGLLALDVEVPYSDERQWRLWLAAERAELPRPWPEQGERRAGADGSEYELRIRTLAFDPLEQRITREIRARMWRNGELVADEQSALTENRYFRNELLLMLEQAGFVDVEARGQHNDEPPTPDDEFLVFLARRPEERK